MKIIILLAALAAVAGCTDPEGAKKALAGAGYSRIEITGYSFFSCSKDDARSTGFKAVGPSGVQVSGAVCSGLIFKNSTIRTE